MGTAAVWSHDRLGAWTGTGSLIADVLRLALAIGVALLVLAGGAWLLRIREFDQGVALVTRRFRRSARTP
jgi:hypothetical protein